MHSYLIIGGSVFLPSQSTLRFFPRRNEVCDRAGECQSGIVSEEDVQKGIKMNLHLGKLVRMCGSKYELARPLDRFSDKSRHQH